MKDFWLEDEDNAAVSRTVQEKDVVLAEKMLGVKLPELYKKLIKKQNGGYIQRTIFPIDFSTSSVEEYIEIHSIYGIGEEGILGSAYLIDEWGLPNDIVLLDGDGHSWIAMDYRGRTTDPTIVYIDIEDEVEFLLANSFEEFIERLQQNDDSMELDMVDENIDENEIPNLDTISKKEAEHIFQTSDDEILIRSVIINIPLKETDLTWMIDQLNFLIHKHPTVGMAEETANFLLMHSETLEKKVTSKYNTLLNHLQTLSHPGVKQILDLIGKIELI